MSESQEIDLSKLALNRSHTPAAARNPRYRRWISRYVLPASILTGFVGLLVAAAGRQLVPAMSVTVVPVIVQQGEIQPAGKPLFQAAGWIEPRPTSFSVPALAPGVIEELLVVEGQEVEQGQPIARLISIDAQLAAEQARALLSLSEGELQRAEAELEAALSRRDNPLHLKVPLAEARSLLAKAITEKEKLPFLVQAAEANVEFTRHSAESKQRAKDALPGVVVLQAKRDYASARAGLEELLVRGPNLEREIAALQEKTQALEEQLALLVEEQRQVAEAQAKVVSAKAVCDDARLQIRQADLRLQRMEVRAPLDGRVLRLIAAPGNRVMGLEHTAGQSSSTVVEMYDPGRLQVRADVRLEDVPNVTPGAPVEIQTASSSQRIEGRVLQSTSSANVQKNTLEVKVELVDPPSTVGPEMLVTATFLAPESDSKSEAPLETERILVPRQLVTIGESDSLVWIVDENNQADQRLVTLGEEGPDGLIEVIDGLNAMDKLIASGTSNLSPGRTVVIQKEDQRIGVGR
jgi:HlyD family secretion protein